jgi:hypothetical protein
VKPGNKIKIKFFLAVCLLCFNFYAQTQPQLKWGNLQHNNNQGSEHVYVTAEDSNNIYVIKRDYAFKAEVVLYLEGINKKTSYAVFSKRLVEAHNNFGVRLHFDGLRMIESNLYLLSSLFEKNNSKFSCYATPINTVNGVYGETGLIYSTTITQSDNPFFKYSQSPDTKKLLISPVPYDSEKNNFKIIDKELNEVEGGAVRVDNKPVLLKTYDVVCNNHANICLFIYRDAEGAYLNGELILYNPVTKSGKAIKIKSPDRINIYDTKLLCNDDIFYFFAMLHPFHYNRTIGLISATVDADKQEIIDAGTSYLNRAQLDEISGVSRGWKDSIGVYFISDVFVNTNKEVFLVTEQGYHTHQFFTPIEYNQYATQGIFITMPFALYRSYYISVFKLKQDCSLDWIKMIPKAQEHVVSGYLSYSAVLKNDQLFLLYNDYLKNHERTNFYGPATMANHKKAVGVLTSITGSGTVVTKPVYFPKMNDKLILKPVISSSRFNTFFVLSANHNSFKWGILDLPLQP